MNNLKPTLISVGSALAIFLFLSIAYMSPALEGKKISKHDIIMFKGSVQEIQKYEKETGKDMLWTNSMFGGMPSYLIKTHNQANLIKNIHKIITLWNWRPVCFMFLYFLGFYLTLLAFGVNRWLSIVGAVAYGFSAYFFQIIVAGHISKVFALGYLPPIIGGIHLAFRRKYLLGAMLMGTFLSLQILVNHLQITYYTLLIALFYGLFELIAVIREKQYKRFLLAVASLMVAGLLAVGSNLSTIWTTLEYGKYSIRGGSELKVDEDNQTSGLDKDYATDWSYGVAETFTLLIPNFHGGPTVGALPENSETYELLKQYQGAANARKAIQQIPLYWGDQPSTAGPQYVGAIIFFLFVLGLFLVDGKTRGWILSVSILAILLSWGRNFQSFNYFLLDHMPGYNKFRTVAMALVIVQFTMPLLGILAVNRIVKGDIDKKKLLKATLNSLYIVGGVCLLFILTASSLFDFESAYDQRYIQQGANEVVNAFQADRLMLLRRDAFRSLVFVGLAASLIWLYTKDRIKLTYFIAMLGLLILIDMWPIAKRYLNNDNFISKREDKNPIAKSQADTFILQDTDPNYRVLNLATSPFQDAATSYFHKSLGGYHGAKMRRYQELINFSMQYDMQTVINALRQGSMQAVDSALRTTNSLNILNTRYIIFNPEAQPLINRHAMGNAWLVSDIEWVENANEEIQRINQFNPATEVLVDQRYKDMVPESIAAPDSIAGTIELTSYTPIELVYESNSTSDQIGVFSEIYYPKGWNVTIDGKPSEYFRVDYLLRGMVIPAGKHEIVFSFHPTSYYTGNKVAYASSAILLLLLLGVGFMEIRKAAKE